jgi:hypothetical protein
MKLLHKKWVCVKNGFKGGEKGKKGGRGLLREGCSGKAGYIKKPALCAKSRLVPVCTARFVINF